MVVRYRTPFAPEFNFIVKRPFVLDGHSYSVGDEVEKGSVNVRLLQKLYEQHKIDAVIPSFTIQKDAGEDEAGEDDAAKPKKAAAQARQKAKAAAVAPEPEEPASEPPVADAAASQYRIEPAFGGVKVVGPSGVIGKYKSKAEAEAAIAELSEG
jgi:pyruvate/2-oxoglutarate dehydrogenase complex dihydrolipoamide acyltransferase (E2) component